MSSRDPFAEAERILRKHSKKREERSREIQEWREKYRKLGPIEFSKILPNFPDSPPHPEIGCKPEKIILSSEQEEFLSDLWLGKTKLGLIVAARGAGKTAVLAVWNCWRITCFDYYTITCMGGSQGQSDLIQGYIDYWRDTVPEIRYCIPKSTKGGKQTPRCVSRYGSMISFSPCSTTAARGPHVNEVQIDEACVPPDTEIITNNDFLKINENISKVLTHEGKYKTIEGYFKRKYNGRLIHIQPYFNNIGVSLTPNHPILIIQRKEKYKWKNRVYPEPLYRVLKRKPEWISSDKLKENDILVFPIPPRKIENIDISNEKLKLIGYYISEGSTGDHQIYYSNKDESFINDVIYCAEKEFGKKLGENKYGKGANSVSITTLKDGTKNVYFSHEKFREWLLKNCGKGSKNKQIPHDFMRLPDKKMKVLLDAILRGDGYEDKEKIQLHVSSRKLVQQFWLIYLWKNILTAIKKHPSGYYSWILWKKKSSRNYGKIINNFIYVPIYKIKKIKYSGYVHNLKVKTIPSYTVPYISLHNCSAEEKSKEGAKAVDAAWWQIVGKGGDTILLMSSTAHYLFGKFYEYLTEPKKYGFTVYHWSIAKHISGKSAELTYTDAKPENWIPTVWWITNEKLKDLRRAKSNEEWLCEALGGISMASGAIFNFKDLDFSICSLCEECEPYKWGKCKLVKALNLGDEINPTKFVIDRRAGYDYGAKAPNALTIVGRKGKFVLILFNDELKGARDEEILEWINNNCKEWKCYTICPDPSAAGFLLSQKLEDEGYAVYLLDESGKTERLFNIKKFIERHLFIIPKAYWCLTKSLKKASYDDKGNVRKIDDHSLDTLCYACVDWIAEEENISEGEFWKTLLGGEAVTKEEEVVEDIDIIGTDVWKGEKTRPKIVKRSEEDEEIRKKFLVD